MFAANPVMLLRPQPKPPAAGGGGGTPVWTFTAGGVPALQNRGFSSTAATFSSIPIGTAAADRLLVAITGVNSGGAGPATSLSYDIGGGPVNMTKITEESGQTVDIWVSSGPVTSSTTATFILTYPNNLQWAGLGVGNLTGVNTSTIPSGANIGVFNNGFSSGNVSVSATVPNTGFGIIGGINYSDTHVTVNTGISIDGISDSGGSNFQVFLGHTAAGTGASITSTVNTPGSNTSALTMAAWGP